MGTIAKREGSDMARVMTISEPTWQGTGTLTGAQWQTLAGWVRGQYDYALEMLGAGLWVACDECLEFHAEARECQGEGK